MRAVVSVTASLLLSCFVNDVTESSDAGSGAGSPPTGASGPESSSSTTATATTGANGAGTTTTGGAGGSPSSCTDEVRNGNETDVDCGGGCDPCKRGLACAAHADCETGACVLDVCERAVIISGTAKTSDAVVDDYATSDSIVRIDFAAEPAVQDADGNTIVLPLSVMGSWELAAITAESALAQVVLGSLVLTKTSGRTRYQTIEPDYFGLDVYFEDGDAAETGATQLNAAGLNGTAVEIYIVDTSP